MDTKEKLCDKHLLQIDNKLKTNTWAKDNPNSAQEILEFLNVSAQLFGLIPGYIQVLKSISQDLNKNDSIKWLNYFSQIRCAYYLQSQGIAITAFEKKTNEKVIDLELGNKSLCEVKSFEAQIKRNNNAIQWEELVFDNFVKNKLMPAFDEQGADLIIIDDIFSDDSKNYRFLNYFLSFINDPDTDRYAMIHEKLGRYLPKILIVSFTQSMTLNPVKRLTGKEWKQLFSSK